MPFCTKCGMKLDDDVRFCTRCGNRVEICSPPVQSQPVQAPYQAPPQYAQPAAYMPFDFSAIPVRHCCANGHITDGNDSTVACPTCGAPFPKGGIIHIYRMGNYMGAAVGMGIYIDGVPYGHLGNRRSIRISVPYGQHQVHMTHTTTRSCNDPVFNITPQTPYICCKAHFSKAGFSITVEPASPDSMPQK